MEKILVDSGQKYFCSYYADHNISFLYFMIHGDQYSHDYTLKGLADVGYISSNDLPFFLELSEDIKNSIIQEIQEILFND